MDGESQGTELVNSVEDILWSQITMRYTVACAHAGGQEWDGAVMDTQTKEIDGLKGSHRQITARAIDPNNSRSLVNEYFRHKQNVRILPPSGHLLRLSFRAPCRLLRVGQILTVLHIFSLPAVDN